MRPQQTKNKYHEAGRKEALYFRNPYEVYVAIRENDKIKNWLNFISSQYIPSERKKVLLFYPCSAVKPYYRSRSYKKLINTLSKLGEMRREIHLITVSEPFGLIPEEFYYKWKYWYECPGLFKWWCSKHGEKYSAKYVKMCIEILGDCVSKFLKRAFDKGLYDVAIGFVRTYSSNLSINMDHTHRKILEKASQLSGVHIDLLPPKDVVKEIVEKRGRLAWDLQGVAHPIAQEYLLEYLINLLNYT